jgi:hypothetical protein
MPKRCDCCGLPWSKLFDAFVNGKGWQQVCAGCLDPDRGPPCAYTGPYPVTRFTRRPALRVVDGDAGR